MTPFQTTIKSGLPVLVFGRRQPADPSSGYPRAYFEVDDITFLRGSSIPPALWTLISKNGDLSRIEEEGLESCEPDPDYLRDLRLEL